MNGRSRNESSYAKVLRQCLQGLKHGYGLDSFSTKKKGGYGVADRSHGSEKVPTRWLFLSRFPWAITFPLTFIVAVQQ